MGRGEGKRWLWLPGRLDGQQEPLLTGPPHLEGQGGEAPAQMTHLRCAAPAV